MNSAEKNQGSTPAVVRRPETVTLTLSPSARITPLHLDRFAIVYVRQSSPKQVLEHRESTARQYGFAEQAVAFGWPRDRVLTIDEDQGKSGRTTDGCDGFHRLVTEVTLNHVGVVLGLEMSRLVRSSKDWHAFSEMCAIFGTLIVDEDGVYDGNDPNDRLLLGLKGIMSEMELHIMRNRLQHGRINKAQRGELIYGAPYGYVKLLTGKVDFDPDEQARAVVRLLFDKFDELGSVYSLFLWLVKHGVNLPIRPRTGPNKGRLEWHRPSLATLNQTLHHPMYAALRKEREIKEEYDRYCRQTPPQLSAEDEARIAALASDIPALWNSPQSTNAHRQEITCCLIERVVVHVESNTDRSEAVILWIDGYESRHDFVRAVRRYAQYGEFDRLLKRVTELREAGKTADRIADTLNAEGFVPLRRDRSFNQEVVYKLLVRLGFSDERMDTSVLGSNEWYLTTLAEKLKMPRATLWYWASQGWVHSRRTTAQKVVIVWADIAEISRLKKLLKSSWRGILGYPLELTTPKKR
jgi:DNA invertase Pin-like site-specific DNA recombinase